MKFLLKKFNKKIKEKKKNQETLAVLNIIKKMSNGD